MQNKNAGPVKMTADAGLHQPGVSARRHRNRSEDQLRHVAAWRWCGRRACAVPHFGAQQPQSLRDESSEAHFTRGERDLHLMSLAVGQRANQTIVSSPVNRFLDIPDAHHFTPFLLCQVSRHFTSVNVAFPVVPLQTC
ncbi:hypothetical protein [Pandoraea sputorum]|uniref:hypothetical protein n=1 Tax=Pandoraea sputorum TaxID=93222 RepID=UPI0012409306|nr:hypothetical protein [Pandoraea sputorum]